MRDISGHRRGEDVHSGIARMLGQGLRAYQAFAGLGELAEDLRILSLNAELAAGRAGSRGNGIRALTQLTRELVRQLNAVGDEMARLKGGTYGAGAQVLNRARRLRLLDEAQARCANNAAEALDRAGAACLTGMLDDAGCVAATVERLSHQATKVQSIARQAKTVATNIAIEAAHAGAHGQEFRVVAETMAGYTSQLGTMIAEAAGCVAEAMRASQSLRHPGAPVSREAA